MGLLAPVLKSAHHLGLLLQEVPGVGCWLGPEGRARSNHADRGGGSREHRTLPIAIVRVGAEDTEGRKLAFEAHVDSFCFDGWLSAWSSSHRPD